MNNSTLQFKAKQAKKRLGNFNDCESFTTNSVSMQIDCKSMLIYQDKELLPRMLQAIRADNIVNPIAQIMNVEYFNNLNETARQKYILQLASLYNELRAKILYSNYMMK
ncbi:MAG: hypothetical protein RR374_00700 [Clostridia bacterium]